MNNAKNKIISMNDVHMEMWSYGRTNLLKADSIKKDKILLWLRKIYVDKF